MKGSKNSGGRPWTKDEISQLMKLRKEKLTWRVIAERLNRTIKGVQAGFYHYSKPEDRLATERVARAIYLKEYRAKPRSLNGDLMNTTKGARIPEETVKKWHLRAAAPQTLTGMVFGDPPIGFSALDMRSQQ